MSNLIYDEFQQIGVDYKNGNKVCNYDDEMSFRNFELEAKRIIKNIGLKENHTVIDFGTGTGNFAIEAAKACKRVYAIDISQTMLKKAKEKAELQNINNITFVNSGFLNYEHDNVPVDAVVSDIALHHLPDFWKQIALLRIHSMLNDDGVFYLADQVYSFDPKNYKEKLEEWVEFNWERSKNLNFKNDVETSIKNEFTTFEWIMDNMLNVAGFSFKKLAKTDFFIVYLCKKIKSKG